MIQYVCTQLKTNATLIVSMLPPLLFYLFPEKQRYRNDLLVMHPISFRRILHPQSLEQCILIFARNENIIRPFVPH